METTASLVEKSMVKKKKKRNRRLNRLPRPKKADFFVPSMTAAKINGLEGTGTSTTTAPKGNSKIPSSPTEKESELVSLLYILDRIYHRNRNQHRRSAWWRDLALLRKSVRGLVEMGREIEGLRRSPSGQGAKATEVRSNLERIRELEEMQEDREKWSREILIPRCWRGFAALVADNQFGGNLGVVLIAVLAGIAGVVGFPSVYEEEVVGNEKQLRHPPTSEEILVKPGTMKHVSRPAVEEIGTQPQRESEGQVLGEGIEDVGEVVQRGRSGRRESAETQEQPNEGVEFAGFDDANNNDKDNVPPEVQDSTQIQAHAEHGPLESAGDVEVIEMDRSLDAKTEETPVHRGRPDKLNASSAFFERSSPKGGSEQRQRRESREKVRKTSRFSPSPQLSSSKRTGEGESSKRMSKKRKAKNPIDELFGGLV